MSKQTRRLGITGIVLLAALFLSPFSSTESLSAQTTSTPTVLPTSADPYAGLTIDALTARSYGGGQIKVLQTWEQTPKFTRQIISYPSDGLTIYGFIDIPNGPGPFPVVIALHGHVAQNYYQTLDYTTRYADSLANGGFFVIHPNMRGFWPSDKGTNLLNVGLAVDVLNLIAIVQAQGGQPGALAKANPQAMGMWGHSMGGGVSIRVMTISPALKAVLLYSSVSGDDAANAHAFYQHASTTQRQDNGENALPLPPDSELALISPINYLDRIRATVSINYGLADKTVDPAWSMDLCNRLQNLNKPVECFSFPGEGHIFGGQSDLLFQQRAVAFFAQYLKN